MEDEILRLKARVAALEVALQHALALLPEAKAEALLALKNEEERRDQDSLLVPVSAPSERAAEACRKLAAAIMAPPALSRDGLPLAYRRGTGRPSGS